MRRPRAASKRSAIVGSLSVSAWLSMMRALLRFSIRSSALSTWATRSGVAMSVSSQPATLAKSSGRWTASLMGLPSPGGADDPDEVGHAGGDHGLPKWHAP